MKPTPSFAHSYTLHLISPRTASYNRVSLSPSDHPFIKTKIAKLPASYKNPRNGLKQELQNPKRLTEFTGTFIEGPMAWVKPTTGTRRRPG